MKKKSSMKVQTGNKAASLAHTALDCITPYYTGTNQVTFQTRPQPFTPLLPS